MTLADMIQEYLDQQGRDLTDQQRLAIDLLESQYPDQAWSLVDPRNPVLSKNNTSIRQ